MSYTLLSTAFGIDMSRSKIHTSNIIITLSNIFHFLPQKKKKITFFLFFPHLDQGHTSNITLCNTFHFLSVWKNLTWKFYILIAEKWRIALLNLSRVYPLSLQPFYLLLLVTFIFFIDDVIFFFFFWRMLYFLFSSLVPFDLFTSLRGWSLVSRLVV